MAFTPNIESSRIIGGIFSATGASGYLLKLQSSGNAVASSIFENATGLGIGTTGPAARLHVIGASGDNLLSLADDGLMTFGFTGGNARAVFNIGNSQYFRITKAGVEVFSLSAAGYLGLGATVPSSKLDISGPQGYNQFRMRTSYTPTSSADSNGNVGDIAWDESYIYWKTSGNGWMRAVGATF